MRLILSPARHFVRITIFVLNAVRLCDILQRITSRLKQSPKLASLQECLEVLSPRRNSSASLTAEVLKTVEFSEKK